MNTFSLAVIFVFTAFIGVTYGFGIYLFATLAPAMREALGFSYGDMGVITSLAQVSFLACALLSGFLTARMNSVALMLSAVATCVLALWVISTTTQIWVMAVALIALAGTASAVWTPMVEATQHFIPPQHHGRALGLMSSGTAYGVFINGLIIQFFLDDYGWRFIWLASFVLTAGLWGGAWLLFRGTRTKAVAQTSVQVTMATRPTQGVAVADVAAETQSFAPGDFNASNRLAALVIISMFFHGFACVPFQNYFSSFLVAEYDYRVVETATAWKIIGVVGMFSGFLMGWLGDKITIRWSLMLSLIFLLTSTLLLTIGLVQGYWIWFIAVCFGMAFYPIFGLVPAFIARNFSGTRASRIFGLGNVGLGVGAALGNVAGGALKTATGSFVSSYSLFLASALIGCFLCFYLIDARNEGAKYDRSR